MRSWMADRHRLAASCAGALAGAMALSCLAAEDWPILDLRLPLQLYDNGKVRARLHAEKARTPQGGDVEAQNARIEMLAEDGATVEGWAELDQCRYFKEEGKLTSDSRVRMERGNLGITGKGLDLVSAEARVSVLSEARVEVRKQPNGKREEAMNLKTGLTSRAGAQLATGLLLAGALQTGAGVFDVANGEATTNSTVITSDRLDYNYRQFVAEFEGNVVVDDTRMHIEAEKMTVLFHKDNSIKSATAIGNVRIRQGDRRATCHRAVYLAAARQVIMTRSATAKAILTRGTDTVAGDVITFWLDDDRMVVEPGIMTITPGGGALKSGDR